ncbi:hypothetical protein [Mycobacteroides sp. PCS013]|uniref:hypothetical protein n=1 Tax=Mycobacteroides sp. PCS013 TaxID=3074106 RepID=UPI003C2E4DAA
MTDAAEVKVSNRGTGFPVLSLPDAAKIIKDAGKYGKAHTATALAGYAGHTSATSGPWKQKASALREWGLISSGSGDSVSLTDRAMKIAHPESPEKERAALLEAFRGSSLFMKFYNDFAVNSELTLAGIASKAVNVHGVSVSSKDKFTKSFVDSAVAVGLAERVGADRAKTLPMPGLGDQVDPDLDEDAEDEEPVDEVPVKRKRKTGTPAVDQTWDLEHGSISFSIVTDKPLAAATYTKLASVVTAIEALAGELGPDEGEKPRDGTSN